MSFKKVENTGDMPASNQNTAVKNRKWKYGALATVVTVLFIVAVIIVNMIVGVLGDRFPLKLDLTQNQVFQLTQESVDFIQGVGKDVSITVLSPENDFMAGGTYYVQANNVIKQYAQYSNRITVNYVDTAKNPNILNKYGTDENMAAGDILVESGARHVVVGLADLFNIETDQSGYQPTQYIKSSKAEQTMTAAVLNVTSDNQVKIALLTGYGEADYTSFADLLKKNNYDVVEQNIVTAEQIDPDAQVAIIYAPTRDYDEATLKKLTSFVSNDERYGKSVVLAASENQESFPNLATFLAQWNIKVNSGLVCETNTNYLFQMSYFSSFSDYGTDTTFTEKLANQNLPVAVPQSKPLEAMNADMVKVLLQTSSKAAVMPADAGESWTPENAELSTIPTALLSTKTKYDGTTPLVGNVVVLGSQYALSNSFLSYNSFNNSAYFLNMFNQLTNRGDTVTIESKTVDTRELGITQAQVNVNAAIFMVALPVAVFVIGLVIWIRRRNR